MSDGLETDPSLAFGLTAEGVRPIPVAFIQKVLDEAGITYKREAITQDDQPLAILEPKTYDPLVKDLEQERLKLADNIAMGKGDRDSQKEKIRIINFAIRGLSFSSIREQNLEIRLLPKKSFK